MTWLLFLELATVVFTAVAGFHLAGKDRTPLPSLKERPNLRSLVRLTCCALLAYSFWRASLVMGWAQAIPFSLSLLSLTGVACLYLAARGQKPHLATVRGMALLALATALFDFTSFLL